RLEKGRHGAGHDERVGTLEIERPLGLVAARALRLDLAGGDVEPVDVGEGFGRPGGAVVGRADEVEVPATIGQPLVRDFGGASIGVGDALEPGDEIAVRYAPQAAIERPAAELGVVAIDDAVLG